MEHTSDWYMGFAYGASRWIHIDGICVGTLTNNQEEYDGVNGILAAALQLGIHHLNVFLDSQLLVSQLNNHY